MSERHLAQRLIHAAGYLDGMSRRIETLLNGMVSPTVPQLKKSAEEMRQFANSLREALHKEGYDRVY